jgi:hypothetical protein
VLAAAEAERLEWQAEGGISLTGGRAQRRRQPGVVEGWLALLRLRVDHDELKAALNGLPVIEARRAIEPRDWIADVLGQV